MAIHSTPRVHVETTDDIEAFAIVKLHLSGKDTFCPELIIPELNKVFSLPKSRSLLQGIKTKLVLLGYISKNCKNNWSINKEIPDVSSIKNLNQ